MEEADKDWTKGHKQLLWCCKSANTTPNASVSDHISGHVVQLDDSCVHVCLSVWMLA